MYPDFKELLALLNKHKVKYLIVGGYAVSVHAQPRVTKDLDILVLPAKRNAKAIFAALDEFGAPLSTRTSADAAPSSPRRALTAKDFEDTRQWFTFGVPPVAVDILPEIPGVNFDDAWKNRSTLVVDPDSGLTAHFISRNDLIAAKLASGRPRDLGDVDELRKAAAVRAAATTSATGGSRTKSGRGATKKRR